MDTKYDYINLFHYTLLWKISDEDRLDRLVERPTAAVFDPLNWREDETELERWNRILTC